ncbi:NusG domain II-containing protein [Anaeroselena agilis]|uniref:NusG domain II-containing protein n=1 Tax=Anaeroselena agilis TaxID=3063788 RepID=A0ABU3NZP8_9FIRM|nr:NusG domain II-containing protein [Selenomonadales bacterium 4137-cl]
MRLTRADKWLIGILLAAAAGGIGLNLALLSTTGAQEARVYREGKLVRSIRLRAGYHEELRLGGAERYNLVVADNGRVKIAAADCPDQLCVRTGWVSVAPQQIVCLPNRVVVKIVSTEPPDVDDITK